MKIIEIRNAKIRNAKTQESHSVIVIELPHPDSLTLDDELSAFDAIKNLIADYGTFRPENQVWTMHPSNFEIMKANGFENLVAYQGWKIVTKAKAVKEATKTELSAEEIETIKNAASDLHANSKLMNLLSKGSRAFQNEVAKAMQNPHAWVAAK